MALIIYNKPIITWNLQKKTFNESPFVFQILFKILSNKHGGFDKINGLDCIALSILDIILGVDSLTEYDKIDIVSTVMDFPCMYKYYNELEQFPKAIFNSNNREKIIKICQEEMSKNIISKYMDEIKINN